ncbi:unnamed protein product [Aureobasidium pullulans]|nr:unnamed protein product [Aureobasidium pullulans]
MAGSCLAQGDLGALLASQPDLSTLLDLVGLVDGLADTLSAASNITIFAPTNDASARVPRNEPEGAAIEYRNETIAVAALLANHVFKGVYPSDVITDVPTFAQTLLNSSYITPTQPFSNITGGAYKGLVKNGDDVCVLSGEQAISTVTQALGEGITIHKVDTVFSFGAPLQLFTYRAGYLNMNAALEAADLGFDVAFEAIGSVLASADLETLQTVLKYYIIPNNVIFSPSLGHVTVTSLQGDNLTFTVLPDGTAWVNNAKITFPNTILYNCVAHVIDTAAFEGDTMTYSSTPALLQTVAAVATSRSNAAATSRPTANATSPSPPLATYTGSAIGLTTRAAMVMALAVGIAALLM